MKVIATSTSITLLLIATWMNGVVCEISINGNEDISNIHGGLLAPDHSRTLQLLPGLLDQGVERICTFIEDQFTVGIECDCIVQPLSGFVGYTCNYIDPVCTGDVCLTSTISGSLDLLGMIANTQICLTNVGVSVVNLGDACVNVNYNLAKLGQPDAFECRASIQGLVCSSCNPCKGGIAMDCSNVIDDADETVCEALNFVNGPGLGGRIRRSRNKINPFIPKFLLQ